jgi:hypothetical protein
LYKHIKKGLEAVPFQTFEKATLPYGNVIANQVDSGEK